MEFVAIDPLVLHVTGTTARATAGATVGATAGNAAENAARPASPVVFLNSLGSDLRIWDGVVERLGRLALGRPLLRYDKRGHGLSDCPDGPYTIRDHADDLVTLLDALAIERAVLVGISVGGLIAMEIAARLPQRVEALVLSDTGAKIGTEESWGQRIELIRRKGMVEPGPQIVSRWFAEDFPHQRPAEYRGYLNMLSRTPAEGYVATCHALRDADLRSSLADIRMPALVLCGSEDKSTPPELGRELAQALPDARFELIEGAGHLPCVEKPEPMAELINGFLEEETGG